MALIIKGEMPKGCNWFDENGKHRFCKVNAFCDCEIYTRGERPSDCPIIGEIPDEHGDLIDRKALMEEIAKCVNWGDVLIEIDNAPVVVEASK